MIHTLVVKCRFAKSETEASSAMQYYLAKEVYVSEYSFTQAPKWWKSLFIEHSVFPVVLLITLCKAGYKVVLTRLLIQSGVKPTSVTTLVNWAFFFSSGAIEQYLCVAIFIMLRVLSQFSFFSLDEILNETIQIQCEM